MTIGIYKLEFEGTQQCYIGQSINIERRYRFHCNVMRKNETTDKLMEAYNKYGLPKLVILIECEIEELEELESLALELYDSINNGFNTRNTVCTSPHTRGEDNSTSIHSNQEIIDLMFFVLENPMLPLIKVSEYTEISYPTVKAVATGRNHFWLKDRFPEEYSKFLELRILRDNTSHNTVSARGIKHPPLISPTGEIFEISNIKQFCLSKGLNPTRISRVLNGNENQHKGWTAQTV